MAATCMIDEMFTVNLSSSNYNKTTTLGFTGKVTRIHLRVPNWSNNVTLDISVEDKRGYEIYKRTGKERNKVYNLVESEVFNADCKMRLKLSGDPGDANGKDVIVVFWGHVE